MGNTVIICGLNGAGKSTLGKRLAQELGWKFMEFPCTPVQYWLVHQKRLE